MRDDRHGFVLLAMTVVSLLMTLSPLSAKTIVYERGGASDSVGIVNQGALHLELGALSYRDYYNSNSYSYTIGETLLRYGLIQDQLEFRLSGSGMSFTEQGFGYSSLGLALKNQVFESNRDYLPRIHMINHFNIPLSNSDGRRFFYYNKIIADQKLTKNFSLMGNIATQISDYNLAGNEFNTIELPWVASLEYGGFNSWVIFTQIFGQASYSNSVSSLFGWNLGCNYILHDDLVLDLTLFQGLNDATADFGIDFGISTNI